MKISTYQIVYIGDLPEATAEVEARGMRLISGYRTRSRTTLIVECSTRAVDAWFDEPESRLEFFGPARKAG